MEVLTMIQARMEGIEARLERQDNYPHVPTPGVDEPVAPQNTLPALST